MKNLFETNVTLISREYSQQQADKCELRLDLDRASLELDDPWRTAADLF